MNRRGIVRFLTLTATIAGVVIYVPTIIKMTDTHGFSFLLPVWIALLVGFVTIVEWSRKVLTPRSEPSLEIHNANFPRPSIKAFDWDDGLIATEEAVLEAFESAKNGHLNGFGAVGNDPSELIARSHGRGWHLSITPFGEPIAKVPVERTNKWADKTVCVRSWYNVFKRLPEGRLTDKQAIQVVRNFLDMHDGSADVSWSIVSFSNREK